MLVTQRSAGSGRRSGIVGHPELHRESLSQQMRANSEDV